jgi:serine protease Do
MRNKLAFVMLMLFLCSQSITSADFQSDEQQSINTAQKLLKATVKIQTDQLAAGSGYYIAPNIVITAEHIIHKAASSQVKIIRKNGDECVGSIGYREEGVTDLAIITTSCTSAYLTLATSAVEGQSVIAVGNPSGYDFTVSKGIVGAIRKDWIQFDAKVNYGSSGGILANISGEVLGLVAQKSLNDPYIGFAIPYSEVKQFIDRSDISRQIH